MMHRPFAIVAAIALATSAVATETATSRTVIGPRNLPLHDGAVRLQAGDGEEGIRLTRQGLALAQTDRERGAAYSNLCAGYILTKDYEQAIAYCNRALIVDDRDYHAYSNRALAHFYRKEYESAQRDVGDGLAINPHSTSLRKVRMMIEDVLNPVEPGVIIEYGHEDGG